MFRTITTVTCEKSISDGTWCDVLGILVVVRCKWCGGHHPHDKHYTSRMSWNQVQATSWPSNDRWRTHRVVGESGLSGSPVKDNSHLPMTWSWSRRLENGTAQEANLRRVLNLHSTSVLASQGMVWTVKAVYVTVPSTLLSGFVTVCHDHLTIVI